MSEKIILETQYQVGELSYALLELARRKASGTLSIEAVSPDGSYQCVVLFHEGQVIYVGRKVPTPSEFITELSQYLKIGILDALKPYAAKQSSVQHVVQLAVAVGTVGQWSDISRAMRQQATTILAGLHATVGNLRFEADNIPCDLRYPSKDFSCAVNSLLMESQQHATASDVAQDTILKKICTNGICSHRPTILSVSDSSEIQNSIAKRIGRISSLETCNSALEALEKLNHQARFALVLIDRQLPDMGGVKLCRIIRGIEKFKSVPIAILSKHNDPIGRITSHFANATHFIPITDSLWELPLTIVQYTK